MNGRLGAQGDITDAIVVVPGILGTELRTPTGQVVWGLDHRSLTSALLTGNIYDRLRDDTLAPAGVIRLPVNLPGLGRFEPYGHLIDQLELAVTDPAAVLEFGYDWRRPVTEAATQLAIAAAEHLERWRHHRNGTRHAQLVFVAHSMGGLLCRHALHRPADRSDISRDRLDTKDVRRVITLGTPFGGSAKAVRAVSTGDVLPLGWALPSRTKRRLRKLARELPSVHDLLPSYPCINGQRPTADQLIAAGANRELLNHATAARTAINDVWPGAPGQTPVPFEHLVGVAQPTLQSFTINASEVTFAEHVDGTNWFGDGTVYLGAAYLPGATPLHLPQSHGALSRSPEAIAHVIARIRGLVLGPPMGAGLGALVPEAVTTGEEFTIQVRSAAASSCRWTDPNTGLGGTIALRPSTGPAEQPAGGDRLWSAQHRFSTPGLYRLVVDGAGTSPSTHEILVEADDDTDA